jgi:hypothetical protein
MRDESKAVLCFNQVSNRVRQTHCRRGRKTMNYKDILVSQARRNDLVKQAENDREANLLMRWIKANKQSAREMQTQKPNIRMYRN